MPDIEARHTGYVPPFSITDFNSTIVNPKSSAVTAVWIPIFFSRGLNGLVVRCVRGMNSFINFFFSGLSVDCTVEINLLLQVKITSLDRAASDYHGGICLGPVRIPFHVRQQNEIISQWQAVRGLHPKLH